MKPVLHPLATQDFKKHFAYLRRAEVGGKILADFLDAAEEAKLKIGRNPRTWSFAPGSRQVRRVHMQQFRMQVFYRIMPNGVPLILEFAGPGAEPRWPERA